METSSKKAAKKHADTGAAHGASQVGRPAALPRHLLKPTAALHCLQGCSRTQQRSYGAMCTLPCPPRRKARRRRITSECWVPGSGMRDGSIKTTQQGCHDAGACAHSSAVWDLQATSGSTPGKPAQPLHVISASVSHFRGGVTSTSYHAAAPRWLPVPHPSAKPQNTMLERCQSLILRDSLFTHAAWSRSLQACGGRWRQAPRRLRLSTA